MMKLVALGLALLAAAAQQPQEPPVLPPGQFCQHVVAGQRAPAHPCACHRECVPSEDADGRQTVVVQEDAQCKQFCHSDHCHCPAKGCE